MYGGIGVSAPSLHRESTDSLIMEPTRLPPKYQNHNRDLKYGGHRDQVSHSSQRIDSTVGVGLARSLA